jgi:hypothetical protein
MGPVEKLRRSFYPSEIRVLFVGESAPARGTFFYNGEGHLYHALHRAFGCEPDFLAKFKACGFYLDDLILTPVNHIPTPERKALRGANEASLARRIAKAKPRMVVAVMRGIGPHVASAIRYSKHPATFHTTAFPANGRAGDFARDISALMPQIMAVAAV